MKSLLSLTLAGIAGFAPLAQAATLVETSDYSGVATAPTVVAAGTETVSGSLTGSDWDYLALSLDGVSTVSFSFSIADRTTANNDSYAVYYSYAPFKYGNNSWFADQWSEYARYASVALGSGVVSSVDGAAVQTLPAITIDPSQGTTLYLALANTSSWNGGVANYNITTDADATVPAVPLPAGGVLLASAVGAAGFLRRRKAA